MAKAINTDEFSASLRARSIDVEQRKLLVTNFHGSEQEKDLSTPANCNGYGRIRHFRRETSDGWPLNPLPIDPAAKALGVGESDLLQAQVFQNASCNWRCWYCYVPFSLLAANEKHAAWLSASDLIDLYLAEPSRPKVIDLSADVVDTSLRQSEKQVPCAGQTIHKSSPAGLPFLLRRHRQRHRHRSSPRPMNSAVFPEPEATYRGYRRRARRIRFGAMSCTHRRRQRADNSLGTSLKQSVPQSPEAKPQPGTASLKV